MSREFPDWINPWAAAQARREFRGTLPLARMRRLAPLLADAEGEARFECRLMQDGEGRPVIQLRVSAELALQCQASLEPYREPIERHSELGVLAEESEEQLLPGHLEPVWAPTGRLALLDLVEDELLLAMPPVPRDPSFAPQVREFFGPGTDPEGANRPGTPRPAAGASAGGKGPLGGQPPAGEVGNSEQGKFEQGGEARAGETRRPFADLARMLGRSED